MIDEGAPVADTDRERVGVAPPTSRETAARA